MWGDSRSGSARESSWAASVRAGGRRSGGVPTDRHAGRGGKRVLTALRQARAQVREYVWTLAGEEAPDVGGLVVVYLDGVLVIAHSEKQDAAATWKKAFGRHPLTGFVGHGPGRVRRTCGRPAAARERGQQHRSRSHRSGRARSEAAAEEVPPWTADTDPQRLRRRHPRVRQLAVRARPVVVVLGRHDHH